MSVLIYIENTDGQLKKSAFEVATYGKDIASQLGTEAIAISIGDIATEELSKLGAYGISKVLHITNSDLSTFVNQAYASIITAAAKQENASVVVLSNTFSGKGLAPRIATKLEAGLVVGATSAPTVSGASFEIKKSAFSNKAIATVVFDSPLKVISINPNSYPAKNTGGSASIENFTAPIGSNDFSTLVKDIIRATDKVSLPEAEIVVSAGRGMKGPENWTMIEELAEVLGAATACSKPVSDAGWRPHSEHVGQTGIVVSPNLYIAIGISGAIQHLAGVSSSKTIVVINKDPEAPFFKVADYGIVGDAFTIVPKLIEALKAYKGN
ncbi:electron transfer flavoprotein subunit alpha/FixB family protein [Sphingobacterium bovistauri]|uniref:Electron transfer flavoprotein subunit alpha/FixB family protein n=1 Tax=Sphingobacterium bovistauri TaxID=2781959 RepID=A0ABS7Z5Z4_9SPHI|nr:electron transfer flavoprotein subunit alpha/FixB family protein [Sphingobacterium bovistauri]MCA5005616.1 electron transfer flavoprotein subunit alpha/FixB family protein [Sphingobacterium bovistauri]